MTLIFIHSKDTSPFCGISDTRFVLLVMSALNFKARVDPIIPIIIELVMLTSGGTPADLLLQAFVGLGRMSVCDSMSNK